MFGTSLMCHYQMSNDPLYASPFGVMLIGDHNEHGASAPETSLGPTKGTKPIVTGMLSSTWAQPGNELIIKHGRTRDSRYIGYVCQSCLSDVHFARQNPRLSLWRSHLKENLKSQLSKKALIYPLTPPLLM